MAKEDRSCRNCRFCRRVSEDKSGLLVIYRCDDDGFEMEDWQRDCFCCHNHHYERANKDAE